MTSAINRLAARSRLGRELGVRLDLIRATGLRHALARRREDALAARTAWQARTAVYRRIWDDAADRLGADLVELAPALLEARRDGARARVRHQTVALDDVLSIEISLDKRLVHGLLADAGLPVPEHVEFSLDDEAPALEFLAEGKGACVVKPAASTGAGSGVATGIRTREDLARASRRAARFGSRLLIERQAAGHIYRLLVLDGETIDAIRRWPPRVVGDGRSTIEELVAAENRRRLRAGGEAGLWPLRIDLDALVTLGEAGLELRSIPAAGDLATVKTVSQQNRNEDNETVREPISGALAEQAVRAAEIVGLRVAGVDVITPDLGSALEAAGGVVLEVNGEPGLHHHYQVAEPERATRVAVPVLERALATGAPARPRGAPPA